MTRSATLIAMSIATVAQAFSMRTKPAPLLLWNASASVPIGFYSIEPVDQLAVTNLVIAMPPNSLATFLAERGYLPLRVPLIKRILALRGQAVCRNELVISVDGIPMGTALAHDRRGRPLPVWQGCRAISQDEVFLMNWTSLLLSMDAISVQFHAVPLLVEPSFCGHSTSHDHALRTHIGRDPLAETCLVPGQLPARAVHGGIGKALSECDPTMVNACTEYYCPTQCPQPESDGGGGNACARAVQCCPALLGTSLYFQCIGYKATSAQAPCQTLLSQAQAMGRCP